MSTSDLSNTASRFEAIIDGSADAIISANLDGTITTWNPAATRLFGFTLAEAVGQSLRIITPPARQSEQDDLVSRIIRGHSVGPVETVRQRKDGILVPIALTLSPVREVRGERGEIVGASWIARRLSDDERAEAGAPADQADLGERLRALVAASRFLLTSPRVEDVLSAMVELAGALMPAHGYAVWRLQPGGWKIETSRGVSDEFARQALPTSRDSVVLPIPFSHVLLAEDVQSVPVLEERRDAYRTEGIVSLLAIPLTIGDETSGTFVCYYRDRHAFTEVERQTAAAFGNMASAALTTAALYGDQSRRHEQSSFLAEASAVLGTSLDYRDTLKRVANLAVPHIADWCAVDLVDDTGTIERLDVAQVDPGRLELARQIGARVSDDSDSPFSVRAVIRTGKSSLLSHVSDEMIVRGAADPDRILLARELSLTSYMCVPLLTPHRRPLGALSFGSAESGRRFGPADLQFAEDLAGRAALAVDNARAYDEARKANQLKDEFLATLSHELRTPLNAIVGYARMLEAGVLGQDKQMAALKIVNRNATALTQIVEDVLDVSRIVSGKVRLDVQPVDLSTLLTDAVATTRLAADAKGIAVAATIDPRAGLVSGDPDRLRQVLWNLLSNAVKFTRRGGHIQARLERVHSHVEVVVSDTGVGLSPAFLPHVFERFRQADSRLSREHGGLGLGLAISRHLVEMHGGTIAAESEGEEMGATFRVCIPVMLGARPSDVERQLAMRADPHMAGRAPIDRLDGLRVVAVDDEEDALALLRDILQAAGASVTTVRSPVAARAVVEVTRPDVFITDIGMKEMDGFKLLEQVRQSPVPDVSRVPAVALTAYARSEDRLMALRVGFQMHLAKPVDPDELIAAVRTLARPANTP